MKNPRNSSLGFDNMGYNTPSDAERGFDTHEAVLKANAKAKKWIVYSVVVGSFVVLSLAGVLVGLYLTGNLQRNSNDPSELPHAGKDALTGDFLGGKSGSRKLDGSVDPLGGTGAPVDPSVLMAAGGAGDVVENMAEAAGDVTGDLLDTAGEAMGDGVGSITDTFGEAVDSVGDTTRDMLDDVSEIAGDMADTTGDFFEEPFESLNEGVENAFDAATDAAEAALEGPSELFDDVVDNIGDGLEDATDGVEDMVENSSDMMEDALDNVSDRVDDMLETDVDVPDVFEGEGADDITDGVDSLDDVVDDVAGDVGGDIMEIFGDSDGVVSVGDSIADVVEDSVESAKDVIENTGDMEMESLEDALDKIREFLESPSLDVDDSVENIKEAAENVAENTKEIVEEVVDEVGDVVLDDMDTVHGSKLLHDSDDDNDDSSSMHVLKNDNNNNDDDDDNDEMHATNKGGSTNTGNTDADDDDDDGGDKEDGKLKVSHMSGSKSLHAITGGSIQIKADDDDDNNNNDVSFPAILQSNDEAGFVRNIADGVLGDGPAEIAEDVRDDSSIEFLPFDDISALAATAGSGATLSASSALAAHDDLVTSDDAIPSIFADPLLLDRPAPFLKSFNSGSLGVLSSSSLLGSGVFSGDDVSLSSLPTISDPTNSDVSSMLNTKTVALVADSNTNDDDDDKNSATVITFIDQNPAPVQPVDALPLSLLQPGIASLSPPAMTNPIQASSGVSSNHGLAFDLGSSLLPSTAVNSGDNWFGNVPMSTDSFSNPLLIGGQDIGLSLTGGEDEDNR